MLVVRAKNLKLQYNAIVNFEDVLMAVKYAILNREGKKRGNKTLIFVLLNVGY